MLAPPPRIWPAPPPAHVNGTSAATRYGYSSLAQILPSPQDKGDDQNTQNVQQAHGVPQLFSEEPVKVRKETKHICTATEWRRKERGRVKTEPGLTPCQVQEVTTSSKHEQNGGIPVGIAVARQRVQTSTPPPLTLLTCEERSTNHVTGWTGPPPHWHYPGLEPNLPLQMPPLQLGRDPLSGQLLLLPSGESVQRTVLWPGSTAGNSSAPPPLVMPAPQPVLLDRFVTLAPQASATQQHHHHHHHQEKRRSHDHTTTTIHGGSSSGGLVGLFPPQAPAQTPLFMMPFSHQNNSLLLSTQLTEHNLNMVVTNHQLSESAVLNPMEVITSPVDGFGGGGMIQQIPPSVVISHTETNSFMRSDINTVYPAQQVQAQPQVSAIQQQQIVVKEETELTEETPEEEVMEEETKAEVMDASNQTESPVEESEGEEEVAVKEEVKDYIINPLPVVAEPEPPPVVITPPSMPELDMSGLNLLCCVASADKETSQPLIQPDIPIEEEKEEVNVEDWSSEGENMSSGLGLLCTAAERLLEEEVVGVACNTKDVVASKLVQEEEVLTKPQKKVEEELSEEDDEEQSPQDSLANVKETNKSPEKIIGDWYTSSKDESGKDLLKLKIKRRPGRPKKKSKPVKKAVSPSRHEPPVLQPWSASPNDEKYSLGSPPTLTPHKRKLSNDLSQESDEGSTSSSGHPPPLSPACSNSSSSKKRKVGRPKKTADVSPEKTETTLTNKTVPSNKAIVDLILSNKHQDVQQCTGSQNKIKPKLKAEAKVKEWCDDEEIDLSPGKENGLDDPLLSRTPVWTCPVKSKSTPVSPPRKPKIKSVEELKKEDLPEVKGPLRPIMKTPKLPTCQVKSPQSLTKSPSSQTKSPQSQIKSPLNQSKSPTRDNKSLETACKSPNEQDKTPTSRGNSPTIRMLSPPRTTPPPVSHRVPSVKVISPHRTPVPRRASTPLPIKLTPEPLPEKRKSEYDQSGIPDCRMTEELLKSLPCRILSISDGQFYPGEVTKVMLPGIYEVHIYKERCRKPIILCQEQVLETSVVEVHCTEDMLIPAGTRVCAYWSQQYSCFYPGRVVSDSASGQVPIDFDDGDNGNIDRTSVRFLPQDYPLVEQPPNPLAGKRKRYNSTTSSDGLKNNTDTSESEINANSTVESDKKLNSSFDEDKCISMSEKVRSNHVKVSSPDIYGKLSETEDCTSSEETAPSEVIRSVLEGFFRSEQEKKERQKNLDKMRKRHKHHKHRDGCKIHKCKHNKHHRSHKHKRSRDELSRISGSPKAGDCEKEKRELVRHDSKDENVSLENQNGDAGSPSKSKCKVVGFLTEKQEAWSWVGEGVKRGRALGPRGKGLKIFYKAIQRGDEIINTGDCAVFVSTGRPDRPFIGQIEQFWQCHMKKNMVVKIAWFYHPEETIGCPDKLPCPGGVFKSSHIDHNDVQTISHRCEVLALTEFQAKAEKAPHFMEAVYEINDTYYLAGFYDPTNITLTLEPEVSKALESEQKKDTN